MSDIVAEIDMYQGKGEAHGVKDGTKHVQCETHFVNTLRWYLGDTKFKS
jgi:hypothetical protein